MRPRQRHSTLLLSDQGLAFRAEPFYARTRSSVLLLDVVTGVAVCADVVYV